jgi:hypothetical protein
MQFILALINLYSFERWRWYQEDAFCSGCQWLEHRLIFCKQKFTAPDINLPEYYKYFVTVIIFSLLLEIIVQNISPPEALITWINTSLIHPPFLYFYFHPVLGGSHSIYYPPTEHSCFCWTLLCNCSVLLCHNLVGPRLGQPWMTTLLFSEWEVTTASLFG